MTRKWKNSKVCHPIFPALMICMTVLAGGCGFADLLEQVPADFSLSPKEEMQQAPREEAGEQASQEAPASGQSGEVRELSLEKIDGSAEGSFLESGGSRYAYQCLSDSEKLWYCDMERILGRMEEKVKLSEEGIDAGLDEDAIDRIFQCVLCDHPELFYVEGYSCTRYTQAEKTVAVEFSGTYGMDRAAAETRRKEILQAVALILRDAPGSGGDYAKMKYIYETLVGDTEYDIAAADNQNIYSVFINRVSVCQGYAKAVQYLMNKMDLFCTLVQGSVLQTGEGHAWNLVRLDGEYYYVDATWGDISYQGAGESVDELLPRISYDYLCITTEQLLRTHRIGDLIPMPICNATADNYYVRENALFTEYDREKMEELVAAALAQGRRDITLCCESEQCYLTMCDMLLEQQEIFDFLAGTGANSFAYTKNDLQRTLTFFMMTSEG